MSRRPIIVLAVLAVLVAGGLAAYWYAFDTPEQTYASYTPPPPSMTDEQRIYALQNDLGNAAAEMAQLQGMAKKLQFGRMKAMGRHLQEVADQLEPQLADIEDPQARAVLAKGITGLRTVGEGAEELDQDKSLQGVDDVLASFDLMRQVQAS